MIKCIRRTSPDTHKVCRKLIEEVLKDWENNCDGIYLYANDTVLDFYPKFGFEKAKEYQCTKQITPVPQTFTRLDMGRSENVKLLEYSYN